MRGVTPHTTASQRLASLLLGEDIATWIERCRHPLPDTTRSWDTVAAKLSAATDGQVKLRGETIRKWHVQWVRQGFVDRLEREVGAA